MPCVVALFCSVAVFHPLGAAAPLWSPLHRISRLGDSRGSSSRIERPQTYFYFGATSKSINDPSAIRYASNGRDPWWLAASPALKAGLSSGRLDFFVAAGMNSFRSGVDASTFDVPPSKDYKVLGLGATLNISDQSTLRLEVLRTDLAISRAGADLPAWKSWAGDGVARATLTLRF